MTSLSRSPGSPVKARRGSLTQHSIQEFSDEGSSCYGRLSGDKVLERLEGPIKEFSNIAVHLMDEKSAFRINQRNLSKEFNIENEKEKDKLQ